MTATFSSAPDPPEPTVSKPQTVTAVLTVHNRRPMTLACLDALAALRTEDAALSVVLFDDGSTDGTGEAVAATHPEVTLLSGDGSFFWNGGMRVAMARAMADDPDHLLWVNDDTVLQPDALQRLLDVAATLRTRGEAPAIVVGSVVDPDTGETNYSGVVQDRVRRMWFKPVTATDTPVRVDSMNGNCVLVPREVYREVGNLDPGYQHSMGDYDYGLRATAAGFGVWVAPGTVASCPSNPGFVPSGTSVKEEFSRLRGTKHLPPGEWLQFVRRWGGPVWPVYWLFPYLRRLSWILRQRAKGLLGR